MLRMILFVVALLPLLATVTCKPAEKRICRVVLPHDFNENHDLQHDCGKDERFKVSFNRLVDQEDTATIELFFEPKDAHCVEKLGLVESKFFCGWKQLKSSSNYEPCDHRPDYEAQWQDSVGGIHIEILRSTKLEDALGCE